MRASARACQGGTRASHTRAPLIHARACTRLHAPYTCTRARAPARPSYFIYILPRVTMPAPQPLRGCVRPYTGARHLSPLLACNEKRDPDCTRQARTCHGAILAGVAGGSLPAHAPDSNRLNAWRLANGGACHGLATGASGRRQRQAACQPVSGSGRRQRQAACQPVRLSAAAAAAAAAAGASGSGMSACQRQRQRQRQAPAAAAAAGGMSACQRQRQRQRQAACQHVSGSDRASGRRQRQAACQPVSGSGSGRRQRQAPAPAAGGMSACQHVSMSACQENAHTTYSGVTGL